MTRYSPPLSGPSTKINNNLDQFSTIFSPFSIKNQQSGPISKYFTFLYTTTCACSRLFWTKTKIVYVCLQQASYQSLRNSIAQESGPSKIVHVHESELRFEESPRLVPSPHRRALPEGQPFLGLRTCASVRFAQRQLIAASQQHAACVGLRPILGFAQYIGRRPILQSNKLLCNIVLLCPPKGKLPAGQGLAPCRQDVLHAVCGTSAAKLLRLLSRRAKPCGFAARFCGAP